MAKQGWVVKVCLLALCTAMLLPYAMTKPQWWHIFPLGISAYLLLSIAYKPRSIQSGLLFLLCYTAAFCVTNMLLPVIGPWALLLFATLLVFVCESVAFRKLPAFFRSPWFTIPLLVKLIVGSLIASDYLQHGVLPIVQAFVMSTSNPYDAVGMQTIGLAYPLSPLVLFALAVPLSIIKLVSLDIHMQLLLIRIPLLAADIGILYLLHRLLRDRDELLLKFYWCSPIILYVTYVQGQLDLIPIFLLVAAVYAIARQRELLGVFLLGLGVAAKANVLVAVPFVFLYFWRHRVRKSSLALYAAIIIAMAGASFFLLAHSPGFQLMLALARGEIVQFILSSPVTIGTLSIYLVPLLLILFGLRISYYRMMSLDTLLMGLGVAFMLLVILIPPRSGWFLWSLPFIIYFFLKHEEISRKHLLLFSAAFLLYFAATSSKTWEYAATLGAIAPIVPTISNIMTSMLMVNLAFTALVSTMVINCAWVYSYGIISRFERMKPFFIGIAGDSGSGKSRLSSALERILGERNVSLLEGDDLHRWQRGDANWEKLTHLDPKANRLHEDLRTTKNFAKSRLTRRHYDHATGTFTAPKEVKLSRFVLVSGLHSLYLDDMRSSLDLKVFMDPDPQLQTHWKVRRDIGERGSSKEKVLRQIKQRAADSAKHIKPQREFADVVISFVPVQRLSPSQVWSLRHSPRTMLELRLKNSISVDALIGPLQSAGLNVEEEYNSDLKTKTLIIDGKITAAKLLSIAATRITLFDDLARGTGTFDENLEGVAQLLLLGILSERLAERDK